MLSRAIAPISKCSGRLEAESRIPRSRTSGRDGSGLVPNVLGGAVWAAQQVLDLVADQVGDASLATGPPERKQHYGVRGQPFTWPLEFRPDYRIPVVVA